MDRPIKILHLEDSPYDAELIRETLEAQGIPCDLRHVENRESFEKALQAESFDVVLCDYSVPGYSGFAALELVNTIESNPPVILLSGTLGEDQAVESLKQGATDYILKQRLFRLGPAIRKALEQAEAKRQKALADEALRLNEERLSCVLRATNDAVWDWDLRSGQVWWNQGLQTLFGYNSHEVQRDPLIWASFIHEADRQRVISRFQEVLNSLNQTWGDEYRFRCRDGSYAYVFDRGFILRDEDDKPCRMIGSMMDITERKQAEEKIRWQAELLDNTRDAIFVKNLEHRIYYWNAGAEKLYGWTSDEVIGKLTDDILYKGDPQPEPRKILREEGEWRGEVKQLTKEGKEITVLNRRTVLRGPEGNPIGFLSINTDITEQKRLEAQFLQAQRMEVLGSLAGGIAHDLNNMLAPIQMAVSLIRPVTSNDTAAQCLDVIANSAQRGGELVQQILAFARGANTTAEFSPTHVLRDVHKLLRASFPRGIQVEISFSSGLWSMRGDPTQFHQILMNLCVNARDAMPNGGTLTMLAENNIDPSTNEKQLVVKVRDTGTGIPPEILPNIFDPFFTTKAPGKGTGLGLSTVKKIVNSFQGNISVASKVGEGTTFILQFPAVPTRKDSGEAKTEALHRGHGERVLIADDEAAIREIVRPALQGMGYVVTAVANGAEALEAVANAEKPFDLVVTDLSMPIMSGKDLIPILAAADPNLVFVIMTGSLEQAQYDAIEAEGKVLLRKPFTTASLLRKLREALTLRQSRKEQSNTIP